MALQLTVTVHGVSAVYSFDQGRVLVGRGAGADVALPHASVSHRHATVRQEGGGLVVVDEHSTNGTYVQGVMLPPHRPKALRSGDVIQIGVFRVTCRFVPTAPLVTSTENTSALARRILREAFAPRALASPELRVLDGPDRPKAYALPPPPSKLRIGRGEACEIALSDADASREHAELRVDFDGVRMIDLGSKNGTTVNGRRTAERVLRHRDEIGVGGTVLIFDDPAEAEVRAIDALPDAVRPEGASTDDGPDDDGPDDDAPRAHARSRGTSSAPNPPAAYAEGSAGFFGSVSAGADLHDRSSDAAESPEAFRSTAVSAAPRATSSDTRVEPSATVPPLRGDGRVDALVEDPPNVRVAGRSDAVAAPSSELVALDAAAADPPSPAGAEASNETLARAAVEPRGDPSRRASRGTSSVRTMRFGLEALVLALALAVLVASGFALAWIFGG